MSGHHPLVALKVLDGRSRNAAARADEQRAELLALKQRVGALEHTAKEQVELIGILLKLVERLCEVER